MSNDIRAGGAYVEVYADDRLAETLAAVPSAMATAASRIAAAAATGSAAISTAAAAGAAIATTAAARSGALARVVAGGGTVAATAYRAATGSLLGMTAALGTATAVTTALGAQSTITGRILSTVIGSSGRIAAAGFVTSLAGALAGSPLLRQAGAMAGRVAFAGMVTDGFRSGGIAGAIGAALRGGLAGAAGAGVIGATSLVRSSVVGLFNLPSAAVRGLTSGFAGLQTALGAIVPGFGAVGALGQRANAALAATNGISGPLAANLLTAGGSVLSLGKWLGGLAAGGFAVATKAATAFASKAAEVTKAAAETGVSIRQATAAAYGTGLAGVLISPEQISAANALNSVTKELAAVTQVAWAQIGAAAAPVLTEYAQMTFAVVRGVALWLNANQPAIQSAVRVAGAVATVAAGVATLTAGLYVLAPAVGLVLNPFGLLTAAVVAGAAYWLTYSNNGQAALAAVQTTLSNLFETGTAALSGIVDALAAGDLALAAEIGLSGVYSAFMTLTADVQALFVDLQANLSQVLVSVADAMLQGLNNGLTWVENQISSLTAELSKWVTWFQQQLGIIDESKAKALKAEADKTRDQTIANRNQRTALENRVFQNTADGINAGIATERDRRKKAIEAEQEAARERLNTAREEAAAKRKAVDAQLATASAAVATAPARVAETVATVNRSTLGGLGAGRSGTVGFKSLEDRIKEQTEIARETRDLLKDNLSFA